MGNEISFEDARLIAYQNLGNVWWDEQGAFHVAQHGYENDKYWVLIVGAKEYLQTPDEKYDVENNSIIVVNKTSGDIEDIVLDNIFWDSLKTS